MVCRQGRRLLAAEAHSRNPVHRNPVVEVVRRQRSAVAVQRHSDNDPATDRRRHSSRQGIISGNRRSTDAQVVGLWQQVQPQSPRHRIR